MHPRTHIWLLFTCKRMHMYSYGLDKSSPQEFARPLFGRESYQIIGKMRHDNLEEFGMTPNPLGIPNYMHVLHGAPELPMPWFCMELGFPLTGIFHLCPPWPGPSLIKKEFCRRRCHLG